MATFPPFVYNAHVGKEAGDTKNETVKPAVEVSEYQVIVTHEANKHFVRYPSKIQVSGLIRTRNFQVLPYIPPLDPDSERLVNALQSKRVYLVGLADAEYECNELVKVLCPLLGDAEIKKLVQAHCNTEWTDSLKTRYMKAIAGMRPGDFCLSSEFQPK